MIFNTLEDVPIISGYNVVALLNGGKRQRVQYTRGNRTTIFTIRASNWRRRANRSEKALEAQDLAITSELESEE